jgi:hypothetical protein
MSIKLPIDTVPRSKPLQFAWSQVVEDMSGGCKVIKQNGSLHPSVEKPVADLIALTKKLLHEKALLETDNISLRMQVDDLTAKQAQPPVQVTPPARSGLVITAPVTSSSIKKR